MENLKEWMEGKKNEHLECKEAKNRYDFEKLVKYYVALSKQYEDMRFAL